MGTMGEPDYPVRLGRWRVAQQVTREHENRNTGFISARQNHGGVVVEAVECVSGQTGADGIMVRDGGQSVAVLTADCMPLVVVTDTAAVVLHVSRKSLINGLLDKVEDMLDIRQIRGVYVGPHICPHHFTFEWLGEELKQFQMLFPRAIEWSEPWQVSLRCAVQSYFDQWGVQLDWFVVDERCTYEEANLPSYRRYLEQESDPNTARMATVVW